MLFCQHKKNTYLLLNFQPALYGNSGFQGATTVKALLLIDTAIFSANTVAFIAQFYTSTHFIGFHF